MNRADFYAKYGQVLVRFSSYHKYSFTFSGALPDGSRISCQIGGNTDEIYHEEVAADAEMPVINLSPYAGTVTKDGVQVDSFYDY